MPTLKSDLARVDAHEIQSDEYDELPELTDDILARGTVNKDGKPTEGQSFAPAAARHRSYMPASS